MGAGVDPDGQGLLDIVESTARATTRAREGEHDSIN
jgi:hypothetical protein